MDKRPHLLRSAVADSAGRLYTATAPLFNFETDHDGPIRVLPGIELRRWTPEIRGALGQGSTLSFMLGQMERIPSFVQFSWVLSGEWLQPNDADVLESGGVRNGFERAVDALHLIRDEMVAFPFLTFGEKGMTGLEMGASGWAFPSNAAWQKGYNRPYVFPRTEEQDLARLTALISKIVSAYPAGAVSLSLERLNATHLRASDADRIIDSAIALEAILLRDAEAELSYRQAIRGAHLLGGSSAERAATFRLLKKSYDRRSRIVHGGKDPGVPSTAEIVGLTRRIARAFIESTIELSHADLIRKLDADAVRGS